jgi:hypothetical protein
MVSRDSENVLRAHVDRFNEAVKSQDYSAMIAGFAPEAEMVFHGVPVGPYVGREAIANAYAVQPPRDEVRLFGEPTVTQDAIESAYGWASDGRPTGRMILSAQDGLIVRLVITFD